MWFRPKIATIFVKESDMENLQRMTTATQIPKDKLIKRLRYLCYGELLNVFAVPFALWYFAFKRGETPGLISSVAAIFVSFILLQGVVYWRMKLTATQTDSEISVEKLKLFRPIRSLNWLILIAWWAIALLTGPHTQFEWIAGIFLWTLVLLEQINYFYFQLMYDFSADWKRLLKTRRLRKPSLRRQLERL